MNETLVSSGNSTEGRIVRLTIIVVVVVIIIIGDVILRTGASSAVDGADPLSAFPSQGLALEAVTLD